MLLQVTLGVVLFSVVCQDIFVAGEPSWTSLRVTWAVNVFSSRAFAKLPRRESKARTQEWTKLPGNCSGKFLGTRYIKGHDTSTIVIYDTNGYIAGLQSGIPKVDTDNLGNSTTFSYAESSGYQLDTINNEDVYLLTAYFVSPSIICEGGRSDSDFEEQGTGTGLYFQNGTNPILDSVHIPLYEEGMNVTHWVEGRCFPTMGNHYWYNLQENMNCQNFFPATIMYNRGKLTSFAFVHFGLFEFSSRFEHPSQSTAGRFMAEPIPECVNEEYARGSGFSSIHVFFSVRPWNTMC